MRANQQPPDVFEMTAMTFGAACSPCSANYVKVMNTKDHTSHDPRAVRAITDYHYVDDYVDSFSTASRAIEISKQVCDIHSEAGFQLRMFRSNSLEVATALSGGSSALAITSKEAMESGKMLGMLWQPSSEHFTYRLEFHGVDQSVMNGTVVPTKRIANCNVCKLKRARPIVPIMGLLPEDRVTPYVRPFTYTGLDYFGPVSVTVGRRTEKRLVALFTCLTVRAIHLEIAYDLSTDACILAIRNFMNRRGVPSRIRSDNGKHFIAIAGEAERFSDVFDCCALQGELTSKGVEWVLNCRKIPLRAAYGNAWYKA
ncbi:uncharacterized protein [Eurosta solidaginis]|uniref:uncharacterized protein n=1 Tax=Eurosta solidaginis TaxID=178769 RepID=UPI003530C1A0